MADRMPSGKKSFATSDVVLSLEEKLEMADLRDQKIEKEIAEANERKEKTIADVEKFNEGVLTIGKEVQNLKIIGNKVLVRLFKHNPYKTGFYQPIMVPRDRNDSGRYSMEEAELQFSPRGIIVNMSSTCSDNFKAMYKVGDVVDLVNGIGLGDFICVLDKTVRPKLADLQYFLFTENMIEKGFKDNLGLTVKFEQ